MKRTLLAVIAFLLMLAGCAYSEEFLQTVSASRAARESCGQAPAPMQTPAATPKTTVARSAAPSLAPAKTDPAQIMLFSAEETAIIKELWPLKQYAMDELGELWSLVLAQNEGYIYLSGLFLTSQPYEELTKEFQSYINGQWEESENETHISHGSAEDLMLDCRITRQGGRCELILGAYIDGIFPEISGIFGLHWPKEFIEMPGQLEGVKPAVKVLNIAVERYMISYEWNIPKYREAYEWLRGRHEGETGFKEEPLNDGLECFYFLKDGVEIRIAAVAEDEAVLFTYSVYAKAGLLDQVA